MKRAHRDRTGKPNTALCFAALLALLALLAVLNLAVGSVRILPADILRSIGGGQVSDTVYNILWQIRMPRALAALVLGGALGLAGYLLQTFFHNPIAGPFVLGISSGAKLTVALMMVFLLGRGVRVGSWGMIAAAFAGAAVATGFVLILSGRTDSMAMLIVSGVMIGYICSAVTDLVVTFAQDADIVNLHNWSRGSFSGITWENVAVMAAVVCVSSAAVLWLAKPIGAYQTGEGYAVSVGVNVPLLRFLMVLLSSILAACITAFAGPVSFVGIAVPHLVKGLFRTAEPIVMVPACFLGGAVFCLLCDLLARALFAPTELSISTVTAVFGAPVVIAVMFRRRKAGER